MKLNETTLRQVDAEILPAESYGVDSVVIDDLSGLVFSESEVIGFDEAQSACHQSCGGGRGFEVQHIKIKGSDECLVVVRESAWLDLLSFIGSPVRRSSPCLVQATLPSDISSKILGGSHPVAVIRRWRNMTARELAKRVGVTPSAISQIEHSRIHPSTSTLHKLAECLNVPYQILIPIPKRIKINESA